MNSFSKYYLFSLIILRVTMVHGHDDNTEHEEPEEPDDNSGLIFLAIFVIAIALSFYISHLYGKKLKKLDRSNSNDLK